MRVPRAMAVVALALAVVPACVSGPGEVAAPLEASWESWVTEVQPLLAERCGNPSCHGDVSRPLEVFGVHRHRLDPSDTYVDAPLTDEELAVGYDKARALIVPGEAADESLLLRKPVPTSAGGAPHQGGVQFQDPADDPDYEVLWAWIAQATGEAP